MGLHLPLSTVGAPPEFDYSVSKRCRYGHESSGSKWLIHQRLFIVGTHDRPQRQFSAELFYVVPGDSPQ